MFNLRIISVCLGHTGVQIKRWVPLTSNLLKWKSKLHFHWDFQDNFLCQSILFSPTRPVWFGMIWFSSLLLSIPFLTLHCDPLCFLLGECVGIPPQEVWQQLSPPPTPSPLPTGTLRNLSHLLLRDGLACVCGTLMCPEQHFDCSGVGLYNFEECLDFLHLVDYSLDPA